MLEATIESTTEATIETTSVKPTKTDEYTFGYIQKTDTLRITIALKTFSGHAFIDFREEYCNEGGVWHYTKKGFTLSTEICTITDFKKIVDSVAEYLENN